MPAVRLDERLAAAGYADGDTHPQLATRAHDRLRLQLVPVRFCDPRARAALADREPDPSPGRKPDRGAFAPSQASLSVDREHPVQTDLLKAVAESARCGREMATPFKSLGQLAHHSRAHFASAALPMRSCLYPDPENHALDPARTMNALGKVTASDSEEVHGSLVHTTGKPEDWLL